MRWSIPCLMYTLRSGVCLHLKIVSSKSLRSYFYVFLVPVYFVCSFYLLAKLPLFRGLTSSLYKSHIVTFHGSLPNRHAFKIDFSKHWGRHWWFFASAESLETVTKCLGCERHAPSNSTHNLFLLFSATHIWVSILNFFAGVEGTLPIDPWCIGGPVIKGFGRGSKVLGIPTGLYNPWNHLF